MWSITKVLKMNKIRIDDRKHSLTIFRLMRVAPTLLKKQIPKHTKSPLEHLLCAETPGGFVNILHCDDRYTGNIGDLLGEEGAVQSYGGRKEEGELNVQDMRGRKGSRRRKAWPWWCLVLIV